MDLLLSIHQPGKTMKRLYGIISRFHLEHILSGLVLAIIIIYTYALFFRVPYAGFDFTSGRVFEVYVAGSPGNEIQVGDWLLQIGKVRWEDFRADLRQTFFDGAAPGQVIPIRVLRNDQELAVNWIFPGPTSADLDQRLIGEWWLPYVIWLAGTITMLFLRPRDTLWRLLMAFYYLTAIWLAVGSGPSHWHVWESAVLLKAVPWLFLPVYWHLHWRFPKPLGRLPTSLLWMFYLGSISLAIAQWFQWLPSTAYEYAFLLAVSGSLLLLVAHVVFRPEHRRDIRLVGIMTAIALVPSLVLAMIQILNPLPPLVATEAMLALPAIPLAYLYVAFRRQAGDLELRANRAVSLYLFLILLGAGFLAAAALAKVWFGLTGTIILFVITAAIFASIVTIAGFSRFQRFVEYRLLAIPLPPTQLLETYSTRITTSLDKHSLIRLLKDEVLPSLLVRQSALLQWDDENKPNCLYSIGIEMDQFPSAADLKDLTEYLGKYLPASTASEAVRPISWIRLALPLRISNRAIGLWLMGRRDPDDVYAQAEIDVLQSIANQTAIAMVNIAQAERLHALYQANIEQQDAERTNLARDLHDDILNQLAALSMKIDTHDLSGDFQDNFQVLTTHIRQIISGLRSTMLTYGLGSALEEFVDELSERAVNGLVLKMDLPPSEIRYDPKVEEHLFHIVQQAGENAFWHAHAATIRIGGMLEPGRVNLLLARQTDGTRP
jgi:signal transduction histidine kinase